MQTHLLLHVRVWDCDQVFIVAHWRKKIKFLKRLQLHLSLQAKMDAKHDLKVVWVSDLINDEIGQIKYV